MHFFAQCLSKLLDGVENSILGTSFVYGLLSPITLHTLSYLLRSRLSTFSWTSALLSPRTSWFCDRIRRGGAFSATSQIPKLRLGHQVIFPHIIYKQKVRPCSSDRRALSMVRRHGHHAKFPAVHWFGTRKLTIMPITEWALIHAWWVDIAKMSQTMFKPLSLVGEGAVTL